VGWGEFLTRFGEVVFLSGLPQVNRPLVCPFPYSHSVPRLFSVILRQAESLQVPECGEMQIGVAKRGSENAKRGTLVKILMDNEASRPEFPIDGSIGPFHGH
jgi:hypothetical protein